MLDKFDVDWIMAGQLQLREELMEQIRNLSERITKLENDSNRTPVDHEKVAANIAEHSQEAVGYFKQTRVH